ncbi:hypothetical protein OROGR_023027 [Orobanche gracilis]
MTTRIELQLKQQKLAMDVRHILQGKNKCDNIISS